MGGRAGCAAVQPQRRVGAGARLLRTANHGSPNAPVTPVWPDDAETVEEARANPDVFAKKTLGQIADHTAEVIGKLTKKRR
jgi:hypothetical protein